LASRITLLPTIVRELQGNELNFISFTPGTSFAVGHRSGQVDERRLLYFMLRKAWPKLTSGSDLNYLMRANVGQANWSRRLRNFDPAADIDPGIARQFKVRLREVDAE